MRNTTSSRTAPRQAPDPRWKRCLRTGEASFNILMLVKNLQLGYNKARRTAEKTPGCEQGIGDLMLDISITGTHPHISRSPGSGG